MNALETAACVAYMQSCWPSATVTEDMTAVWAEQLGTVEAEDGLAAVRALMRSSRWFPALSEFVEQTRVECRRRTGSIEGRSSAGELDAAEGFTRAERESNVGRLVSSMRSTLAAQGGAGHRHVAGERCPVVLCPRNTRNGV